MLEVRVMEETLSVINSLIEPVKSVRHENRTRANIQASSVDIYSDGLLESCKVGLSSIVVLLGRSLILCPAGVRKSL